MESNGKRVINYACILDNFLEDLFILDRESAHTSVCMNNERGWAGQKDKERENPKKTAH